MARACVWVCVWVRGWVREGLGQASHLHRVAASAQILVLTCGSSSAPEGECFSKSDVSYVPCLGEFSQSTLQLTAINSEDADSCGAGDDDDGPVALIIGLVVIAVVLVGGVGGGVLACYACKCCCFQRKVVRPAAQPAVEVSASAAAAMPVAVAQSTTTATMPVAVAQPTTTATMPVAVAQVVSVPVAAATAHPGFNVQPVGVGTPA